MVLYDFYNTTNQTSPQSERHNDFVGDLRSDHCLVKQLDLRAQCDYVEKTESCKENVNYIDYVNFVYCTVDSTNLGKHYAAVSCLIIVAAYMFIVLGTTADKFFCPALTVLSNLLKMSETLAGVTLLAFGNGSPDIFTAVASTSPDTAMQFSELYGAGAFITTIIAGTIIFIKPFKVFPANFLRDCLFYMVGLLWIDFSMSNGNVTLFESIMMFVIYLLYLLVVVVDQILIARESKKVEELLNQQQGQRNERLMSVTDELKQQGVIEIKARLSEASIQAPSPNTNLFIQFAKSINPISIEEWKSAKLISKILLISKAPIVLLLLFVLPVVDYELEVHGWSKLLNSVQITSLPLAVVLLNGFWNVKFFGVTIFAYILPTCIPLSTISFWFSRTDSPPKFHFMFAILSAIGSLFVISSFAAEVVSVLNTIGIVSGLTPSFLGSTFLAWGNSIGDLFANVTLANHGYERMGFAACYGGPLLNTLIGMGILFIKHGTKNKNGIVKARFGSIGPNCLTFLMTSLCFIIIALCLTRFAARKSIGLFLFVIYLLFFVYTVLGEFEIIHPYGTDHVDQRT